MLCDGKCHCNVAKTTLWQSNESSHLNLVFFFQNHAEGRRRIEENRKRVLDSKQPKSKDNSLQNYVGHVSAGHGFRGSNLFRNTNFQEEASPATAKPRMNRDTTTQEMTLEDNLKPRKGLAFHFPGAEAGTI